MFLKEKNNRSSQNFFNYKPNFSSNNFGLNKHYTRQHLKKKTNYTKNTNFQNNNKISKYNNPNKNWKKQYSYNNWKEKENDINILNVPKNKKIKENYNCNNNFSSEKNLIKKNSTDYTTSNSSTNEELNNQEIEIKNSINEKYSEKNSNKNSQKTSKELNRKMSISPKNLDFNNFEEAKLILSPTSVDDINDNINDNTNINNDSNKSYPNNNTEPYNKFNSVNQELNVAPMINSILENTEILNVKVKISKDKNALFKVRRFDDLFLTVKLFCEINSIDEKMMRPIITQALCTLNSIYQVYNTQLDMKNIRVLRMLKTFNTDI